ncbi:hypothetical protein WN51_02977 [Melipona quadrifasciata]|uniref:Uncharacterized protein n=1 Tax=Melipona quadrifasciata TaxID=166423 RepID=A0A0N0U491_9HYME|nr:hypothetical protein WN51_02977 [Melipona quadrifasciata]
MRSCARELASHVSRIRVTAAAYVVVRALAHRIKIDRVQIATRTEHPLSSALSR